MPMIVMSRPSELGFLGVGASKDEAVAAYEAAANGLQLDLKKSLEEFPRSAAALNMWPKVMAEETQFWADRQETFDASRGITFWGDRVEKAGKYKERWLELTKQVAAKAKEIGETPKTPGYSPFPPEPKDSGTMWIAAAVITVGVLAAVLFSKKRGSLSGLRRRRRSR